MRIHFHRILYLMLGDTPKIQYPKEVGVRVRSYGETCCMNQQKPKTKIKMKDAKKHKAIYCMTCPIGCRNSERTWSMNVVRQSYAETLSLDIETPPVLLMNWQWSREPWCPHALSEGPKLRYLLEDENNECILHVLVQSCPKRKDLVT